MTSFLFIVNPHARNRLVAKKWPKIDSLLKSEKVEFETMFTQYPKHAIELAKDNADNYDAIVAVGGDGTAHEVANGVIGKEVTFGIFPIGNGNDYAHLLNYPKNYSEIIRILKDFHTVDVPVGVVEGTEKRYFINIAESGITAIISKAAFTEAKWLKGLIKYYYIALKKIFQYKKVPATVKVDDHFEVQTDLILSAVGLGYRFGGGFKVLPNNHPFKEDFAVCVAGDLPVIKQIYLMNKLKDGEHLGRKGVWFTRGKNVTVSLERPLPVEVEGEIVGESTTLFKFYYATEKLKVITPEGFIESLPS